MIRRYVTFRMRRTIPDSGPGQDAASRLGTAHTLLEAQSAVDSPGLAFDEAIRMH